MVLEQAAGFGQSHGAAEPVEEADTELALQLEHVLRERRLAHVERLGGAREVPGARHGEEDLDLAEGHRLFLIAAIRNMYFRPWYRTRYPRDSDRESQEGQRMIFRQLLATKTGCASYVFG